MLSFDRRMGRWMLRVLKLNIGRAGNWWKKNWEPTTAIAALLISAVGTVLGARGLTIANQGIALAYETAVLERAPVMKLQYSQTDMSLTLENVGAGPADVYQVTLFYKDRHLNLWSNADHATVLSAMQTFVQSIFADNGLAGEPIHYFVGVPGLIYRPEQSNKFFSVAAEDVKKYSKLRDVLHTIVLSACYMDLSGRVKLALGSPKYLQNVPCRRTRYLFSIQQNLRKA